MLFFLVFTAYISKKLLFGGLNFAQSRRGRCPHRPVVHGTNSPKYFGNRNILPRGDVGIASYEGVRRCFHREANLRVFLAFHRAIWYDSFITPLYAAVWQPGAEMDK